MCGGGSSPAETGLNELGHARAARETQAWSGLGTGLIAGYNQGSPFTHNLLDYNGGITAQNRANEEARTNRALAMAGIDPNSPMAQQIRASQSRGQARAFDASVPGILNSDLAYRLASARTALGGTGDAASAYSAAGNLGG